MICYDKYGKMTPEFKQYQQFAWDTFRKSAEELTALAIKEGVCPNAFRDTLRSAVECGNLLASQQAYVDDHTKSRHNFTTVPINTFN